ncbi:HAMP domain-containing histidine kinase [Fusibacter paucivorans]|uniref:histidine kinase n=1 Tax=Fusibacter paucivorans TaxID=76009 RepID=A0ABS5PT01_9FIRM|nr:HAMP domain-containing histidine kinase [Fusibacter paucivorans]
MKSISLHKLSLKKRALITFLTTSIVFIVLIGIASRLYITTIMKSYTNERESNNAFIGFEFAKIIRFYAETDPEKLITSDLLQLYSNLEDETPLAVLKDDTVIFGESFYKTYIGNTTDSESNNIQILKYSLEDADNTVITIVQLLPSDQPERPNPVPFKRVDQFATLSFVAYLVLLIFMFMLFLNRILKPLEDVKQAAIEIKNGNLDYQITYTHHDEIGEVYEAIEEMRNELKDAAIMREQYEKNRNELLSNITHDLKTPLTSIKGYIEGIVDGVAGTPEKIQRYAMTIHKHTVDMDVLLNDLFLMSKLDIDQIDFKYETFKVDDFLSDCYEDFYFDLSSKGIQFTYENLCTTPLYIDGDRQNLKRVMINIIQNSLNHLDKGEKRIALVLDTTPSMQQVVITLTDNGKGIPEDQLNYIFDRFYRIDNARSSDSGGSGIGLSIVKKIIDKHDGHITATSALGKWTKMTIVLPAAKEEVSP